MSIQSRIGRGLLLLIFITQQTAGIALAQTAATGGQGIVGAIGGVAANFAQTLPAMYQQNPQALVLSSVEAKLQSDLNVCQGAAVAKTLTGVAGMIQTGTGLVNTAANTKAKVDPKATKDAAALAAFCKADCPKPKHPTEVSCKRYFSIKTDEKEGNTFKSGGTPKKGITPDEISVLFGNQAACYEEKIAKCADSKEIDAQVAMLSCMMDAIRNSSASADTALRRVLAANQAQYANMVQYQGEVAQQMAQVDAILGPDKDLSASGSGEFQGLLGLQKALQEDLAKHQEGEANFEEAVASIDKDQLANDQTLESERLAVVTSCLKGDSTAATGGKALMCPKPLTRPSADGKSQEPIMGANGVQKFGLAACGPLDYIRARIDQQSRLTKNGVYLDKDGNKAQNAMENTAAFDGVMDALMREMGSYDAPSAEGRVDTGVHSWADIQKNNQIMSKLRELDADPALRNVGIVANLQKATNKCMSDSNRWRANQMGSGASRYSKEKLRVDSARKKLNAQLNNGLADLNKNYKNVMSVLSDQAVALDRYTCQKDSTKLMECYKSVRQNVQDLLDGTGRTGFSTKLIKGGTKVGGFSVPCRGVNGCVTALKTVRERQKDHLTMAQNTKMKFVNDGNTQAQSQLEAFGKVLESGNARIQAQYANVRMMLGLAGAVKIPMSLKPMEAEALAQSENGENKEKGPFQNPKNMIAVLSPMAGGLPDPNDPGLAEGIQEAKDALKAKKASWRELADKIHETEEKYASADETCNDGVVQKGGGDSRSVNNDAVRCNNRAAILAKTQLAAKPTDGLFKDGSSLLNAIQKSLSESASPNEFVTLKKSFIDPANIQAFDDLAIDCGDKSKLAGVSETEIEKRVREAND